MMYLSSKNTITFVIGILLSIHLFYQPIHAQVVIEEISLLNLPIEEIEITGNKITQEEIILREMKLAPGIIPSEELLRSDQLRVLGLDIFSRVEFTLKSRSGKSVLLIEVTEEWYIFPLPYWNLSDDNPPQITYGFRYMQKNFRGRDESLTASLWGGNDRGFSFYHHTPWMRGTPSLIRSVYVYQATSKSENLAVRDLDLEYRQTVGQIFIGKRWSREFSSQIGCRFRLVTAENPLQLATGGELDRMLELEASSAWDGRDLRQFPRRGVYAGSRFLQGWQISSQGHYQRLLLDFRYYIPYKLLSLCQRWEWFPGWGNIPPYDWIIVEETAPIRSTLLRDEGESFLFSSLELRIDVLPLHYFTWRKAPIFKPYFRNLQYGCAAEIFLDVGDAYTSVLSPTVQSLLWGYGVGLLLRLPYVDVIRLENSWNPEYSWREGRLFWRVGMSF